MGRTLRIRIAEDGAVEIVDPDLECLDLMQILDPGFEVKLGASQISSLLPNIRQMKVSLKAHELASAPSCLLWQVHRRFSSCVSGPSPKGTPGEISVLDLKIELARRALQHCRLCHHRCGVNRLGGETGRCGLGANARVGEHFLHVAEEKDINPAYVLGLRGCALRCRYCQQHSLLGPTGPGQNLDSNLWQTLDLSRAKSLEFVGGNPDESIYAALCFLRDAPEGFDLPIVWNCHAYGEPVVCDLLQGVADVYVPDFKYGNDSCALKLSGVRGYLEAARRTIHRMILQRARIIVRILALPGHQTCCHLPTLLWLRRYRESISLHIMNQYAPDFRIKPRDGLMASRPSRYETELLTRSALEMGFNLTT